MYVCKGEYHASVDGQGRGGAGRGESYAMHLCMCGWVSHFTRVQDARCKIIDPPKLEVETWAKQELLGSLVAASLELRSLRFVQSLLPPSQQECAATSGRWLRSSPSMNPIDPKAPSGCRSPTGHFLRKEND